MRILEMSSETNNHHNPNNMTKQTPTTPHTTAVMDNTAPVKKPLQTSSNIELNTRTNSKPARHTKDKSKHTSSTQPQNIDRNYEENSQQTNTNNEDKEQQLLYDKEYEHNNSKFKDSTSNPPIPIDFNPNNMTRKKQTPTTPHTTALMDNSEPSKQTLQTSSNIKLITQTKSKSTRHTKGNSKHTTSTESQQINRNYEGKNQQTNTNNKDKEQQLLYDKE
jgi:hypothetical protein